MDKNNSKVKGLVSRTLSFMLAFVMVASGMLAGAGGFGVQEAYAKIAGEKNKQACVSCEMVAAGEAPTDAKGKPYDELLNGAVYRGGNSHSGIEEVYIDEDPNDFANPLPYGNVYVDTSMLNWSTPSNFIIDIKDDRFQWVAVDGKQFEDANGFTTTNDPLESGKALAGRTPKKGGGLHNGAINGGFIAYVGELKPYHSDIKAKADDSGYTNTFKAPEGDYLYRITYLDAATLADGTRGNVIMTMTQVDIETSMSVSEDNPRVLKDENGNEYEYTKAVMPIQGANTLCVASGVVDSAGNWVNEPYTTVLTKEEVQAAVNAANANIPSGKIGKSIINEKAIRHTAGAAYTFDIQVVDPEGNPAVGTMAYAAKDLDLPSYQNIWGRESADPFMYSEGLSILSGSQSYALVPEYNHSDATTLASGWVAKGLTDSWGSPLDIKGGSGTNADGVSFRSNGEKVLRDRNGLWKDSFFSYNEDSAADELMRLPTGTIRDFRWNNINAARLRDQAELSKTELNDNVKKQLAGKVKDASGNPKAWNQITAADAVAYIKDGSYAVERNDANDSYDTGFAVLLNPAGASFRWTGSSYNSGQAVTTLFDSTLFTYIEQTHGTGGGIYFETYDIGDDCNVNRAEGTVTMGKGTDATVTVVPEDGYRIDTIKIGAKALGNPSVFTPVYDASGAVTKIKDNAGTEHALTDGKVTISDATYGSITFEANTGGSIDVTLPNIQDARHIHVDFTADYYFYKVWKSKTQAPTSLKLMATPYAYKFKEVTIDGTRYTISGNTFTGGGKSYTLENNALRIGDNPNITVYYLEGNDLVSYKLTDPEDPDSRTVDKRFTIRLEYEKNGEPVEFEVIKADADNAEEMNVIAETDADGYPVWKIRYPAAGYTTKGGKTWPALPIETKSSAHNINHVERNYWFVTEDAPGWALVEYDNVAAEAPGVIDEAQGRKEIYKVGKGEDGEDTTTSNYSAWALSSVKDVKNAGEVIKDAASSNHAYMSVFSDHDKAITKHNNTWGGKIVNIPLVVVNAEKTWDDFSNAFGTRQDVWFHIDATIDGAEIKDILPPQKLAATESGNVQTKTWGNKKAYGDDYLSEYAETGVDYSKVKVVGTTSGLPKDIYYARSESNPHMYVPMESDGYNEVGGVQVPKYKPATEGNTYYVNELSEVDGSGKSITYTLRETDAKGNELDKSDIDKYLVGYKSEVSEVKKDDEQAALDEVKINSYTGKVKNTLETVDFEVTKIWKENGATGAERTHSSDEDFNRDVTKLKGNYTLNENGKMLADTDALKLQPKTAAAYVPASGDDPASGILETKKGADGTEIVFKWHNIPKYVGDKDNEGKPIVREAVYSVTETALNGYNAPAYDNSSTDVEGKTGATDNAYNMGKITNEVTPPEGTPKQTWGEKNQPQSVSGKDMFKVTTDTDIEGNSNEIKEVKLIDPNTGKPADSVTMPEGTYTVDGYGNITFTPKTGFVGNPTPVGVRGTDANGLSADTTYTPHICDTETTIKRTIVYEYSNGDPVLDGEGNPKTIEQTVTFKGIVNPDTGEITYPGNPTETFPEVQSGDIDGYTVDRPKVEDETVRPRDKDLFEKVIYSPLGVSATPDRTYGLPNEPQNGSLSFKMETETYTDGTPNELTIQLVDPTTGKEVDGKSVPAVDDEGNTVGTYTLNDDGTVTYTPSKDYVGNPRPLEVTGTDKFGTKARTTYTPHIVDPIIEDEASRNITYTYLTEDGKEASATITQKVTMKRHAKSVDPKTGEVLEWDEWEPAEFPAVPNPGHVDEKTWTANKSAQAATVTEPGPAEDVHVVYTKEPYTVIYHNGDHGKSDGKGDQSNEDYGDDVTGGNGVTPAKGWHFTGKYTYVIKDKTGNVIKTGETDDPTTVEIIGNVEFTPVYEPNKFTIKYDANGGIGTMSTQKFTGADGTATSKKNEFTRKNYIFTGFKAKDKAGNYLKDKNGNDIIFASENDFIEYLHAQGDGGEITLVAQWKKLPHVTYIDPATGRTIQVTTPFNEDGTEPAPPNNPTRKGYRFIGWERTVDDEGNVLYEAMWEPIEKDESGISPGNSKGVATGDYTNLYIWIAILAAGAAAVISFVVRRRRQQ